MTPVKRWRIMASTDEQQVVSKIAEWMIRDKGQKSLSHDDKLLILEALYGTRKEDMRSGYP